MTDKSSDNLSGAAHDWFQDGAPVPDDFVDPELTELDDGSGWGQRFIVLMIVAFATLLAAQYTGELRYFFTDRAPLDLNEGAAEDLYLGPQWTDELGDLHLPSNRYVEVSGIPQRRSVSGDREFFALVGSTVFVERRVEDDRPRIFQGTPRSVERGMEDVRTIYDGRGRLVSFRDLPDRYASFATFYSDAYRLHFCGFEPTEDLTAYRFRVRRQAETALRDELGRDPTEAEIRERAGPAAACQEGYLLIDGLAPADTWHFALLYLGYALIGLGGVVLLVRALRRR